MRVHSTINYCATKPCVVALGCFDGVHLGHSHVIKQARDIADSLGCDCAVWTFDEPPKNYFIKRAVPLISEKKEKIELIRKLHVDKLISVPFTRETASISPTDFVTEILINRLKAIHVVCGFNYTFGANGEGNIELLEELCDKYNIGLTVLPPIKVDGITVSSSAIRDSLAEGDPETAEKLLGRPYSLRTVVIGGQHLASRLGFPTVNQEFPSRVLVPKHGVYATRVFVANRKKPYYGITNVGVRPTVGGKSLFAETNIFDFCEDLYGKPVKIEFIYFIREEQKFDGLEQLTEQVNKDISIAKELIKA